MPRAATTVATAVETDVSCGVNSFLSAAGGGGVSGSQESTPEPRNLSIRERSKGSLTVFRHCRCWDFMRANFRQ